MITNDPTFSETSDILFKVKNKQKLSINEQIEYLKYKGITFSYISEVEAKNYLRKNSYYYKITAYRKNFPKNDKDLYYNLDFATLKDLSIIDMRLRYLVLQLSLDVEHVIKTKLITLITESPTNDGFTIIEKYSKYQYDNIEKNRRLSTEEITNRKKNFIHPKNRILDLSVKRSDSVLYKKYYDNPSIWVLIELMSYGNLASFIKFYVSTNQYGHNELKIANKFMYLSKNIRDRAAHSRPILHDITMLNQIEKPKILLIQYLQNNRIDIQKSKRYLTNNRITDLCSLLYLHDKYIVGSGMRKARKLEMINLILRAFREKHLYQSSKELMEIWLIFYRLIKNY